MRRMFSKKQIEELAVNSVNAGIENGDVKLMSGEWVSDDVVCEEDGVVLPLSQKLKSFIASCKLVYLYVNNAEGGDGDDIIECLCLVNAFCPNYNPYVDAIDGVNLTLTTLETYLTTFTSSYTYFVSITKIL